MTLPFLKWAGGKRQLLDRIVPILPDKFGAYFEPFVGGGALFFALADGPLVERPAVLTDANPRLARAYKGVRDDVEGVIDLLRGFPYDRDFFESLRRVDVDALDDTYAAAWMIYLNKAGFNGLYRVNRKGAFNVPFGKHKTPPTICDEGRLRACSAALRGSWIASADFSWIESQVDPGDLVYFDPPYVPLDATSSFTAYTRDGFGDAEQVRLRDLALRLGGRGVHVILSNSSAPRVRELYRDGFEIVEVDARRSINCKSERRGPIRELLIRGRAA